ncbi:MAG: hypothetical protein IMF11_17520 [Proteobacteria bacterium]|nr:hypothetical protein [Pseudomonadota bacterium]MCK4487642.1 hypothetical protein [Desulfobacterales bacterium]
MPSPGPYRLTGDKLLQTIDNWDRLLNFRVRLIACGGTALTLLDIKESTKDIDFMVPVIAEYEKLMKFVKSIGYREKGGGLAHPDDPHFLYQFWHGNRVFTTDLLNSPLEAGKHILIKEWRHIYLGALNLVDLIITKMFRGTGVDMEDCIAVFATGQVDAHELLTRYAEAATYDLNPDKMMQNLVVLVDQLASKDLVNAVFVKKVKSSQ